MSAEVVYLFIEEDGDRCQSLENVIAKTFKLPDKVKFKIINKTYAEAFSELLDSLDEDKAKLAPTFAFIDPFGIKGVPLNIIKRLMEHKGCEVFITIMVGSMNRFISQPQFERHCDELFGTDQWREAIERKGQECESFLRNLYHQRLVEPEDGVGAQYARYFTMKNDRNVTIYDLFFATNHWKGIDAMKEAMWNVDQSGGYSFSDATNPDQEMLFTREPEWERLFDALAAQFAGTEQPWETVEEAIRLSPFRIMRRVLQAESRNSPSRFEIVPPQGARKGTLDRGTRIRFP
jgi:three-Cys-motif partner protein